MASGEFASSSISLPRADSISWTGGVPHFSSMVTRELSGTGRMCRPPAQFSVRQTRVITSRTTTDSSCP